MPVLLFWPVPAATNCRRILPSETAKVMDAALALAFRLRRRRIGDGTSR